ncbi:uncharacterized protein [Triticum aestivum]|uniref:uncharacterized protein n=1 Tax=Triticum aestivum TaxID=4565 RepID=UPI001D035AD1|nr:uncharacterized protein LOC123106103 [Triticum aestivum]
MAAMKQQALESVQWRKEFLVEVLMLTVLSQPNFVSLVGFCAQGDKRLLLYELSKVGHGLRGEATSGSTLHIQENKIKAQIGRTNVDRGGEHHATIHPTRQEIPRHSVLFLTSMHPLCRESLAQAAIEQDGYPSASILAPTRKVNIGAYCVQHDDTSESWPTPPTDLRQRGRSVQKQHEQLFYCWSEGELGKGDRGSSTTTILAYNPMASCPQQPPSG